MAVNTAHSMLSFDSSVIGPTTCILMCQHGQASYEALRDLMER